MTVHDLMDWLRYVAPLIVFAINLAGVAAIEAREPLDRWDRLRVALVLTGVTATLYIAGFVVMRVGQRVDPAYYDGIRLMMWATAVGTPTILRAAWYKWTHPLPAPVDAFGALAALAQGLPLVVADAHGVIRNTSPQIDALTGYPPDALRGRPLTDLMPERFRAAHVAGLATHLRTGRDVLIGRATRVMVLRADGSEVEAMLTLTTSTQGGERQFLGQLWPTDPLPADPP